MKNYIKYILLGMLFGFIMCATAGTSELKLSDAILRLGFNDVILYPPFFVSMTYYFLPFLAFQIIFGTYIYRHFCSGSIYYFTRIKSRAGWFIKEILFLFIITILYVCAIICGAIVISALISNFSFDASGFMLMIYYIAISGLFLFSTTLLINCLAILFTSNISFIIVEGIQIFFMAVLFLSRNVLPEEEIENNAWFLLYNPIAHIILPLHISRIEAIDEMLHRYDVPMDLNMSVILFAVLSVLFVFIGCIIVKNKDFITNGNQEGT